LKRVLNILSIDAEELYHAEYVRSSPSSYFLKRAPRARAGIEMAMDILRKHDVRATFFFVGEVAERWPELTEELEEKGHEIGFHGYHHRPLWEMKPDELREEIRSFRSLLGHPCRGFRAPSFSIDMRTTWALRVLVGEGYLYDSSIFPFRTPLYGLPGAPTRPYRPSLSDPRLEDEDSPLLEFPITVGELGPLRIPIGGGFYLRLMPVNIIRTIIKDLNKRGLPAIIFVHSWELDAKTPISPLGSPFKTFITYYNIGATSKKLAYLISSVKFTTFEDYIENTGLA